MEPSLKKLVMNRFKILFFRFYGKLKTYSTKPCSEPSSSINSFLMRSFARKANSEMVSFNDQSWHNKFMSIWRKQTWKTKYISIMKQKLWSSGRALGSRSEGRGFDPLPMLVGSGVKAMPESTPTPNSGSL